MKKISLVEMYKGNDAKKAAMSVMDSGWFIKGPHNKELEKKFARFCSVREACTVNSGTSALMLAAEVLGVGKGDEVIIPSHTFIASAAPFLQRGAKVVFVDVDPETYTLDIDEVKKKVTPKTVGVVPVHLYGHPADMAPLQELARKKGLWLLEDACQAHGATYNRKKVGGLGTASVFSYFPSKVMTVGGDGGVFCSNDKALVETARMLRDQGRMAGEKFNSHLLGYNFRLSEILAAIGTVQLGHLPDWIKARRNAAKLYRKHLRDEESIHLPQEAKWARHVYYVYTIRVPAKDRDPLRAHLSSKGVATGLYYPVPVHRQPAVTMGKRARKIPVTDRLVDEIVSLPMHPDLTEPQIKRVAREVSGYFRGR